MNARQGAHWHRADYPCCDDDARGDHPPCRSSACAPLQEGRAAVTFRPAPLAGGAPLAGAVDYRLARRSLISEFRKGRLSQIEVCDAHPELLRAAESYSRQTEERCPICEDADLVHVTYVFGPNMPSSGKCVATLNELAKLAVRGNADRPLTCYVVEVCTACHWNHLSKVFPLAGRTRQP